MFRLISQGQRPVKPGYEAERLDTIHLQEDCGLMSGEACLRRSEAL